MTSPFTSCLHSTDSLASHQSFTVTLVRLRGHQMFLGFVSKCVRSTPFMSALALVTFLTAGSARAQSADGKAAIAGVRAGSGREGRRRRRRDVAQRTDRRHADDDDRRARPLPVRRAAWHLHARSRRARIRDRPSQRRADDAASGNAEEIAIQAEHCEHLGKRDGLGRAASGGGCRAVARIADGKVGAVAHQQRIHSQLHVARVRLQPGAADGAGHVQRQRQRPGTERHEDVLPRLQGRLLQHDVRWRCRSTTRTTRRTIRGCSSRRRPSVRRCSIAVQDRLRRSDPRPLADRSTSCRPDSRRSSESTARCRTARSTPSCTTSGSIQASSADDKMRLRSRVIR